jgi:hypothetical protein
MYECGTIHLVLGTIDHHQNEECILRPVKCPRKCGKVMRFCDIPMHIGKLNNSCCVGVFM